MELCLGILADNRCSLSRRGFVREKGREKERESRACVGIPARSQFSSPVLQYIYCSRCSPSPLEKPQDTTAEKRAIVGQVNG